MAESKLHAFNPQVVISLRKQLGYEASDVARLLEFPLDKYSSIENGDATPSTRELTKLSDFFRLDEFNFFRKTLPLKSREINFRAALDSYRGEPGPVLDAVSLASKIQLLLSGISNVSSLGRFQKRNLNLSSNPEIEGLWWRENLPIDSDVQLHKTTVDSFYTYFRSKIEYKFISVVSHSFDDKNFKGLVFGANRDIPVILINSFRQQKQSRSFTLAHEFCHVLLGQDGVSNPYEAESRVERFCNKFAATLLMPRSILGELLRLKKNSETSNATIKWLANKFKVSQEAVVIRLEECGFANSGFWRQWKKQFEQRGYLPSEEQKRGGGVGDEGPDQGINKLAYFGFLFGRIVPDHLGTSKLSKMAVFRASRLKPKYISELGRATKERLLEVNAYEQA
jgi:Zn-dependent peptidase ImmA (M78 family)/transcriptional regulator with XRE-family HTH domain